MRQVIKEINQFDHPYKEHEGTELWKILNKAIEDLVQNQDLVEQTSREYIVGYLCKVLTEKKVKPRT